MMAELTYGTGFISLAGCNWIGYLLWLQPKKTTN
jgi:hypothetical protein